MNSKLILSLSLFGLIVALGTTYWILSDVEPYLWVAVSIACACFIAVKAPGRYFLHGFLVSIVCSFWMVIIHAALAAKYLASHIKEAEQYSKMNKAGSLSFFKAMLVLEPVKGVLTGVLFGVFAVIASRILKR